MEIENVRSERFQQFCLDALAKGPDIQAVEPWSEEGSRPRGLAITFSSGAQLWTGITGVAAPGEKLDQPEAPVTGMPPAEVSLPSLYEQGMITAERAEAYLAALLINAASDEIARAYSYSDRPTPAMHPGVGVEFHSGARANLPFVHTARPGQGRGRNAFQLQSEF